MSQTFLETSFLIPLHRDAELSDGDLHSRETWEWLFDQLFQKFGAYTPAPGTYDGVWKSTGTGEKIADQSKKYIVAIDQDLVPLLRDLLKEACERFRQRCLYLNIAGQVEFVEPPNES